jgi:hypothetical protein
MKSVFVRPRFMVGMLGAIAIGGVFGQATALGASGVPYSDPRAVGSIGLCNAAGQAVTSGGINDVPFVAKAIDSTPAAAPYNGSGETATLFIYQPRQGIDPSNWYGEQFGASNPSSTPQHPTTTLTAGDGALAAALADYPPKWDGLMELRIYLGAPNEPIYNSTYDATDIKITGDKWQVARGASVSCGDGQSVSLEKSLASQFPQITASPSPSSGVSGRAKTSGNKSPGASGKAGAGTSAGAGGSTGGGATAVAGSAAASSSEPALADTAATGSDKGGGPGAVLWILIFVGIGGVAVAAVAWSRSRPSHSPRH